MPVVASIHLGLIHLYSSHCILCRSSRILLGAGSVVIAMSLRNCDISSSADVLVLHFHFHAALAFPFLSALGHKPFLDKSILNTFLQT